MHEKSMREMEECILSEFNKPKDKQDIRIVKVCFDAMSYRIVSLIEDRREACAKIADGAKLIPNDGTDFANGWCCAALSIGQAIRNES